MIPKPKKPRHLSTYTKQLIGIVDQFMTETGDVEPDLKQVAQWAHANGLLDSPPIDVIRVMAKALARACRQDYITDENGEPVRRRHAVKETMGDQQLTLWSRMEDMTSEKFRKSLTSRRNGTVQDALQIERDKRYFNGHYNPGDPIEMDFNLNPDIEEHFMPTVYPESPPEGHSDDS